MNRLCSVLLAVAVAFGSGVGGVAFAYSYTQLVTAHD